MERKEETTAELKFLNMGQIEIKYQIVDLNQTLSIFTLSINVLNTVIMRQRLSNCMQYGCPTALYSQ